MKCKQASYLKRDMYPKRMPDSLGLPKKLQNYLEYVHEKQISRPENSNQFASK